MKVIFPGHYRPSAANFRELWQEATIALDANVLLNLYRYPAPAREDLLSVLKRLSARLFVPYQAALEYQRGRLGTIDDQLKKFDEVRMALTEVQNKLADDFAKLQLQKRHASISPDKLVSDVRSLFDSFRGHLETLEKGHLDVFGEDDIRNDLDEILNGRVGPLPEQKDLDLMYDEGKRRYEQKCPPGYGDSGKAKDTEPAYISNGLKIERQYGDLLVWKQMLAMVAEKKIKHLIFVTDDDKSDWWWRVKGKTLGPRPELVEEARRVAGVTLFYMYTSEQFIKHAKDHLGIGVRAESIEQIREVRREFSPHLKYEGIGNDDSYMSNPLGYPQLVHIKNIQVAVANAAENVTARIEYTHANGTEFTVNDATWLATNELPDGAVSSGIRSSVSLAGNESQPFVLMQVDKDNNHWASKNMSHPVGLLDVGKWTANITVSSDTCESLEGTVGFTVLPDKRLMYDQPAFRYAGSDRDREAS